MSRDNRAVKDPHQKAIVELFRAFDGSKNRRKIFEDFVILTAISISNRVDFTHAAEREKQWLQVAGQYKQQEIDIFSEMAAQIVMGLEQNPDQDFLGEMYMNLDFGSSTAGQFFTPYNVCRMLAAINFRWQALLEQICDNGFVSAADPASGAGALLVAFANECKLKGINYQEKVLFVAQDLDYIVGLMCYIALSYLGCAGYVVIGDSLQEPLKSYDGRALLPVDNGRIWFTPMFFSSLWTGRRLAAKLDLDLLYGEKTVKPERLTIKACEEKKKTETLQVITGTGQMSLF